MTASDPNEIDLLPLPASAFRPGDHLFGTDEGGTYFGEVSGHQDEARAARGEVLVYWSGEDYADTSLGHIVVPDLVPTLRLWPAAKHQDRQAELGLNPTSEPVLDNATVEPPEAAAPPRLTGEILGPIARGAPVQIEGGTSGLFLRWLDTGNAMIYCDEPHEEREVIPSGFWLDLRGEPDRLTGAWHAARWAMGHLLLTGRKDAVLSNHDLFLKALYGMRLEEHEVEQLSRLVLDVHEGIGGAA